MLTAQRISMIYLWILLIFVPFAFSSGELASPGAESDDYCAVPTRHNCSTIPTTLEHGSVEQTTDPFGSPVLVFSCNAGFVLVGQSILTCNCSTHWSDPFPQCAPKDCQAIYDSGKKKSGVYGILPDGHNAVYAFCDMTGDKHGWTVIQRRVDGSVDFYRDWQSYKQGFGNPRGNLWIGLESIHHLTASRSQLYITLKSTTLDHAYAVYDYFCVLDEQMKYELSVSGYHGTAGDALTGQANGQKFTTFDSLNGQCAINLHGGWWYNNCCHANLNGMYGSNSSKGIFYYQYKRSYPLPFIEMKIRRY